VVAFACVHLCEVFPGIDQGAIVLQRTFEMFLGFIEIILLKVSRTEKRQYDGIDVRYFA